VGIAVALGWLKCYACPRLSWSAFVFLCGLFLVKPKFSGLVALAIELWCLGVLLLAGMAASYPCRPAYSRMCEEAARGRLGAQESKKLFPLISLASHDSLISKGNIMTSNICEMKKKTFKDLPHEPWSRAKGVDRRLLKFGASRAWETHRGPTRHVVQRQRSSAQYAA